MDHTETRANLLTSLSLFRSSDDDSKIIREMKVSAAKFSVLSIACLFKTNGTHSANRYVCLLSRFDITD